MLSKVMEVELNETFTKEKKRKKDGTPKSAKKRRISEKSDDEFNKTQSPKNKSTKKQMKSADEQEIRQQLLNQVIAETLDNNEEEIIESNDVEEIREQLLNQIITETLINKDEDETPKSKKKRRKSGFDEDKLEVMNEIITPEKNNINKELQTKTPKSKKKQKQSNVVEAETIKNIEKQDEQSPKKKQKSEEEEPAQKIEDVPDPQEDQSNEEHSAENAKQTKEMLKKVADFDPKQFRQLILNKKTCYNALKDFIDLCQFEESNRDFPLEYLEAGGNTSEIIRVIEIAETKTASFVLPIVEVLTLVLIKIISSHSQKQLQAEESSREFLNKHYSVIKSMLALNSSSKQRKAALKMLSVMVSLSSSTAKEVLSHASFDQSILEILYQPSNLDDGSSVRTHFTHFLISFLVDGNSAVIIPFLEKRNLLSSIFPGLIYDTAEIVSLVLTTIQSRVLEDKSISKTIKMNLFNTQSIQTIVNLYNWKGPSGWNPKKRKEIKNAVNPEHQQLVTESLQTFLLCLCASKHGIIFFDPTVGLSSKKYNPLLLTVLSSLAKPWTNKHKQELLVKICVACPDMVKPVLTSVEGFLEPRVSNNWLNVIHFVTELIESLTPESIETFLLKLQNKQIAHVIQNLCIPQIILAKINDGLALDYIQIRHECVNLLNTMLNSTENYLKFVCKLNGRNEKLIKNIITGYLSRCLPAASVLLKDWYNSIQGFKDDPTVDEAQLNSYLTKLLDVLYQYNTFCPDLVENITKDIDVKQFLCTIDTLSEKQPNSYDLHIKSINLLISCDITIFAPSMEFFLYAVPLLLKFYYNTENKTQLQIEGLLFKLFKLTSVFDCCVNEIMIWLYSILDQPQYDENLAKFLTQALIQTNNEFVKYSNEMTNLKEQFTDGGTYRVIIENLSHETKSLKTCTQNKHRTLSPFLLGIFDLMLQNNPDINSYLNVSLMNLLHFQTNPTLFVNIILQEKYSTIVTSTLRKYISNWKTDKKVVAKTKLSPENTVYYKLIYFLNKEDISELQKLTEYCTEHSKYYTKTIMTNLIMFYYTQKLNANTLTTDFQTKCYELLTFIIETSDENNLILDHPVIIDMFSPTFVKHESSKLSTEFIIKIVKKLQLKVEIGDYLKPYQAKLVEEIVHLIENYSKTTINFKLDQFMEIVQLLGLTYDDCSQVLAILSRIPFASFKSDELKVALILKLESFILGQDSLIFKPFSNETLKQINQQMIQLTQTELNLDELEVNLCSYIKQFPHANINFNRELFEGLITKPNIGKPGVRLAAILLQNNPEYLEVFIQNLEKIFDKRELVFTLINSIMKLQTDSVKQLLETIYKEYEQIIVKYLNKPQKAANYLVENYQVVVKLIVEQLKPEICKEFCGKTHKFDTTEIHHFEALTTVFNKTITGESNEDLKQKYVTSYLTTSMNLLTNLLKRATKTEDDWSKIEKVGKHFCTYVIKTKNVYKFVLKETKIYSGAAFQTFAKLCLKFGLQEKPILVNLLRHLCSLIPDDREISDLGVLFEMAISHSESLNILLSDDEKKAPLLSLLLALCRRCKSVMIKSHIPIWLAAYEATLSETDQYLLQLLSMYEAANIGFHEFRPYLWGKAAVAHYSVRSAIETTLWRQPKPRDVLDLFNENRIVHTVQNFPWTRRLQDDTLFSESDIEVYDPAFYLPLLCHLMAPESTIRWYQGTQRGIISLPIIALTSENAEIRAAACSVLARFHSHLEAATYAKQRFLWLHLIEAVCRGTSILPSLRPCTVVAVFLARCSIIFTRPDHPLYSTLGNYISAKECPNFNIVPELLTMLHSTDVNHTIHRNFILEVIRDGLCTDEDLKVLYKSVAFKLIMDLYNSVLIDFEGKQIILEILARAVTLQNGARTLVSSYNLISWLHASLQRVTKQTPDLFYSFVKILNNLVTSFEDDLFKHLQFNILLLLVSVIDKFQFVQLDLMHLVKYIQVLYKVYEKKPHVLTRTQLLQLLAMSSQLNCHVCNYYLEFGTDYVETPILTADDAASVGIYYLKLLTLKWIRSQ